MEFSGLALTTSLLIVPFCPAFGILHTSGSRIGLGFCCGGFLCLSSQTIALGFSVAGVCLGDTFVVVFTYEDVATSSFGFLFWGFRLSGSRLLPLLDLSLKLSLCLPFRDGSLPVWGPSFSCFLVGLSS